MRLVARADPADPGAIAVGRSPEAETDETDENGTRVGCGQMEKRS